jgi:alcohol dehydrogenase (cytochrome c)
LELPETGPASSWGGTLGLASGIITFVCGDAGMFSAVDTMTGKVLWQFQANAEFRASPTTYIFEGKQYEAIAAGQNVLAFGLME